MCEHVQEHDWEEATHGRDDKMVVPGFGLDLKTGPPSVCLGEVAAFAWRNLGPTVLKTCSLGKSDTHTALSFLEQSF